MKPTNSSYRKDTCAEVSSNCVIWEGPDLDCLQLCKGDSVSDALSKFATEYCDFKTSLDLTEFDLGCLFEPCTACPTPEKSIPNILALLRDKVCELEDLIEGISPTNVVPAEPFSVNLKCLAITDGSGNILNDDSQDAQIQSIIDAVCEHSDTLGLIESEIQDHDDRITELENATDDSVPDVSSDCLFIGTRPVDEAYELLDGDYCQLKDAVGTPSEIGSAIGQEPELPELVGNPAYIVNTTNLAESVNNMWLALQNALDRLNLIENNCCAPTCDNVKIGFAVAFNSDDTATLTFNAGTGTSIPNGWEDCGSMLTVSDANGNTLTVSLTIVNNYTSPNIDMTSFTRGTTLTFSLDSKMCSDSLSCQKCVTKNVIYTGSDCCTYTNIGLSDSTLIYDTFLTGNKGAEGSSITRTVVLKPGESFTLPPDSNVLSASDPANLLSDCDIPEQTSYTCGFFSLILDKDNNDGHSMDENFTGYKSVKINGVDYPLNITVVTGDDPGTLTDHTVLNNAINISALFEFTSIVQDPDFAKRQYITANFRAVSSVFSTIELFIDNRDTVMIVRPTETDCESET